MSFDKIIVKDYAPKTERVEIEVGDETLVFTAKELPFVQRLMIDAIRQQGQDHVSRLLVLSVTDSDGKHMTEDQAASLPPEYALPLVTAALKVNAAEDVEKN